MKAIRCREWGAAGVNFADSLMVGGTYQVKPPFPFTPGLEATGEIVETGSAVDGLQAKQRVLAGCCATAMAMPRKSCSMRAAVVPIPAAMDFVTAARAQAFRPGECGRAGSPNRHGPECHPGGRWPWSARLMFVLIASTSIKTS